MSFFGFGVTERPPSSFRCNLDENPLPSPTVFYKPMLIVSYSVDTVQKFKDKGNEYFKKGQISAAISEYSKGLACFETLSNKNTLNSRPHSRTSSLRNSLLLNQKRFSMSESPEPTSIPPSPPTPTGNEELLVLLTTLLSNRSVAQMQDRKMDLAYLDAAEVVRLRPDWVKGFFRRAEALLAMGLYDQALGDFKSALERDAGNKLIMERVARCHIHIKDASMGLVLRQLLPGRDLCAKSFMAPIQNTIFDFAIQMRNFIYLVGNATSREVMVVDACWDIDGIIRLAKAENLTIVGAIITHYHIDHCGGIPPAPYDKWGVRVEGIVSLLKKLPSIKAYVNPMDIDEIVKANPEIPLNRLQATKDGDYITLPATGFDDTKPLGQPFSETPLPINDMTTFDDQVAAASSPSPSSSPSKRPNPRTSSMFPSSSSPSPSLDHTQLPPQLSKKRPPPPPLHSPSETIIQFFHTPGHTAGSQCLLVNGERLLTGDTLFIGSCGRVDMPGASPRSLCGSLERLSDLPESVVVLPGHAYGGEFTTIKNERIAGLLHPVARMAFFKEIEQQQQEKGNSLSG